MKNIYLFMESILIHGNLEIWSQIVFCFHMTAVIVMPIMIMLFINKCA